ncbi:cytochrome C [Geomesophilobacter sediminis]|uniref:Cytochrome C n=1 Tax=Geomesophilobacter sediminis TaxID=2798584 RepID=A0A8J7JCN0_9BACT|nr:cytochrome C [Geomesophilobacter sediminis]MBJ6724628.1 cytochrome C [Geomesophilobacter sediminis]
MSLKKRDLYVILAVFCLGLVLALGSLKGNGKDTPYDEMHWKVYRALQAGQQRETVEKGCNECHAIVTIKNHPPKEQCLICHKRVQR